MLSGHDDLVFLPSFLLSDRCVRSDGENLNADEVPDYPTTQLLLLDSTRLHTHSMIHLQGARVKTTRPRAKERKEGCTHCSEEILRIPPSQG